MVRTRPRILLTRIECQAQVVKFQGLRTCSLGKAYDQVLEVWLPLGMAVRAGEINVVHSVLVDRQTVRIKGALKDFPRAPEIQRSIELESTVDTHDPVPPLMLEEWNKALRFLKASKHLRVTKGTMEAIVDVVEAVFPGEGRLAKERVPPSHFLLRARCRMDVTMLGCMRRVFSWIFQHDPKGISFLFVDGSPASGFETLNAVEHFSGKAFWSRQLAVSYLAYGHQGLKSKLMSLLWKYISGDGAGCVPSPPSLGDDPWFHNRLWHGVLAVRRGRLSARVLGID
jgi:hypothetical protein